MRSHLSANLTHRAFKDSSTEEDFVDHPAVNRFRAESVADTVAEETSSCLFIVLLYVFHILLSFEVLLHLRIIT